jgi:hypothetical protein
MIILQALLNDLPIVAIAEVSGPRHRRFLDLTCRPCTGVAAGRLEPMV